MDSTPGVCVGAAATHCWGTVAGDVAKANGGADKASCGFEPRVMRQSVRANGHAGGCAHAGETGETSAGVKLQEPERDGLVEVRQTNGGSVGFLASTRPDAARRCTEIRAYYSHIIGGNNIKSSSIEYSNNAPEIVRPCAQKPPIQAKIEEQSHRGEIGVPAS